MQKKKLHTSSTGIIGATFIVYCVVCSGAFGIEEMIPTVGPGLTIVLLLAIQIFWARPICYSVLECNSAIPKEGGIYAWSKELYGRFWGFQAGWWSAVSTWISGGTYIALTAGYLTQLFGNDENGSTIIRLIVVLIFTIVNIRGLSHVSWTSSVLSIMIIFVFASVTIIGIANWKTNPFDPFIVLGKDSTSGLGEGIAIAIWMYCGYDQIATMSEEFAKKKIISTGLKISLPLISLSYILPTIASLACLPEGSWINWAVDDCFAADSIGYASVASTYIGNFGRIIFLITATIAQFASYNSNIATGSRSFYVLAKDNFLPSFFANIDKQGRSPYIIIIFMSITSFFLSFFKFKILVQMEIAYILAKYILLSFLVIKLHNTYRFTQKNTIITKCSIRENLWLFYLCFFPLSISIFTLLSSDFSFIIYAAISIIIGIFAFFVLNWFFNKSKLENDKFPNAKSNMLIFNCFNKKHYSGPQFWDRN